jgi:protein RecA
MAKPKEKKKLSALTDLASIHARTRELGKKFDVPPISLAKGGYVKGAVSFGSIAIDLVTGGGAPPGRFIDIFGPSMSGKSTLSYMASACANNDSIPVIYLDHEASADAKYLTALGIDLQEASGSDDSLFIYSQPTAGENTYRFIHQMLDGFKDKNTGEFAPPQALIVIDSLAAMIPEDEEEDPDKNTQMAGTAKVHSWGLRLIKSRLSKKNVTLIATNQLRLKPGIAYGNPEYEPGGQALTFYPDLKIQVRGKGKPTEERGRSMRQTNVSVPKNKQFPPFLKIEDQLNIAFGYGFDRYYDGLSFLKMTGQIEFKKGRNGGWHISGMPNYHLHGKTLSIEDLVVELFKNDFREACMDQMISGDAFDRLFATLKWGDMYKFDPENHGVNPEADNKEPEHVDEEEAAEALRQLREEHQIPSNGSMDD